MADARHLLRKTSKDIDRKQGELRELVSVRYRDFIDAADTISAMGTSARTIIDTAAELGHACSQMVAGEWRDRVPPKQVHGRSAVSKDVLAMMQAPERIVASLEQREYVAAAVHLLSARERYEALQRNSTPAAKEWLCVPFVRLRARTLMDQSQVRTVVEATQLALRGSNTVAGEPANTANSSRQVADAIAASVLVQGLSLRDALDTFLDARSAAVRAVCQSISCAGTLDDSACGRAGEDGSIESVEALEALMCQVCLAVAGSVCQALELFSSVVTEAKSAIGLGADESARQPPLIVSLLKGLSGVPTRQDMLTGVEEKECCAAVRSWLHAMSAAVNAAATAALHSVHGGKDLAALEQALRTSAAQALAQDKSEEGESSVDVARAGAIMLLWGKVADRGDLFETLFASAFLKRSKEVVAARFMAIHNVIGPLLTTQLQDVTEKSHGSKDGWYPGGAGLGRNEKVAVLFQKSQLVDKDTRDAHTPVLPWDTQCTHTAHEFLRIFHAAVLDCQQLVGHQDGLAGLQGGDADERASLLLRSARDAIKQLASVLVHEVTLLEKVGTGAALGSPCVEQALYLAQTSSAVEVHVASILALLPEKAAVQGAANAEISQLAAAAKRGYGIWTDALVANARAKLGVSLRALKQGGDDIKRTWEEVEVTVETESGENKSEKLAVPSALLPHSLSVLLDTASAIHNVQTPSLPLHGQTVQQLVEFLADAFVVEHEALAPADLGGVEALHIHVLFDLNVCLDLLAGQTRPPALAKRAKALEQILLGGVDPIDYSFLAPFLHTNRGKVYHRHAVLLGALRMTHRRQHAAPAAVSASLPKPINLLPLVTHQTRFGLLPAVDTWSQSAATNTSEVVEDMAGVEEDSPDRAKMKSGLAASLDMDDLQKNVQESLGRFGSFFGQQMAKATDSLAGVSQTNKR